MNITIKQELLGTLTRLAEQSGITSEQYASDYLDSFLLSQYKQYLTSKINEQKVEDLATMESAVVEIDETIKIRDYVVPIEITPIDIVPDLPMDNGTTTPVI